MCCNPNATFAYLQAHPTDRNFAYMSSNPTIFRDIEQNPTLPWDWKQVSRNPNLTVKFVKAHPIKIGTGRGSARTNFRWTTD